jgi:hypothetical protein
MSVAVIDTMRARLVWRTARFAMPVLFNFGLLQGLVAAILALLKVASLQVERMTSVKVAVDRITYVSSVDCRSEVVVEAKTVNSLTQAVEVVILRQAVYELDKLILVNEVGSLGCEDYVASRGALDIEPERWLITPCIIVSLCSQVIAMQDW